MYPLLTRPSRSKFQIKFPHNMRLITIYALMLCFSISLPLMGQRAADWSVDLTGNAQQIILQYLTGVPIVQTEKAYIGLDPASQKIAWTAERSADKALSAVVETGTDFYNMMGTPYVLVRNSLTDSRSGQVLLSKEKDGYKRVEDYEVIPSMNSVLLRTTADGMLRLYMVSMTDNKVLWSVDVVKSGGIGLKSDDGSDAEERIDVPTGTTLVTKSKHLLFRHKKQLACIAGDTGKMLWIEKANPAEVLLSPDEKTVMVIEAESGGLIASAMAGSGGKVKSNTIVAFDLLTGKSPWKDEIEADEKIRWTDTHPDFLTVVHKKGCNLYDYATGEKIWKKDFEGRRVVEILPNGEGYLISFHSGYKSMQLSKEGKELWKKPKVQESEDGEVEVEEEGGLDRYVYEKGDVLVDAGTARFLPMKGSGLKRWKIDLKETDRVAYDESRKNLIILTSKALLVINPDKYPKSGLKLDVSIGSPENFRVMEIRNKVYFLSSAQEYVILDPESSALTHKFYQKPFDGKGFLVGMAGIAEVAVGVAGLTNAMSGTVKSGGASLGMVPPGSGNTELRRANRQIGAANAMNDINSMMPPARFEAFKQTRDFAYFFTKDKSGDEAEKMLIKVNKDTGAEADKLIFDNARPLYQVDEVQKRVYYANKGVLKVFNM